jgi:Mycothiol maleylpyruvate isomerase N-terminal domain
VIQNVVMDKPTLLREMRETHAKLESAIAGLDDARLLAPAPGMDGWTRKDVLAHVEWWNEHSIRVIEGVRTGVDPDPDTGEAWTIDAHNARVLEQNRSRSAADVRRGEAEAFQRLLTAVEAMPEDALLAMDPVPWLSGTLADAVAGDSTLHYPEHVPHLAVG